MKLAFFPVLPRTLLPFPPGRCVAVAGSGATAALALFAQGCCRWPARMRMCGDSHGGWGTNRGLAAPCATLGPQQRWCPSDWWAAGAVGGGARELSPSCPPLPAGMPLISGSPCPASPRREEAGPWGGRLKAALVCLAASRGHPAVSPPRGPGNCQRRALPAPASLLG